MHNKKTVAKLLIISVLLLNFPINSMANISQDYKLTFIDKETEDISFKGDLFNGFFNNLFNKLKRPKEVIKANKNIKVGSVKEITLSDGQFVPNLDGNPEGFETIRVTTTGNKKLEKKDYDNLRTSSIPKVDLSNSFSDTIPGGAFRESIYLTEFKFPQGVTSIEGGLYNGAFEECINLTGNLLLPNTVEYIGDAAFKGCAKLTGKLILPESLIRIGKHVFKGCVGFVGELIIPETVTFIDEHAFYGCSGLTGKLVIPESVTYIGHATFMDCIGFTGDLIVPNTITFLGYGAFSGLVNVDRIVIKVNELDVETNYRKDIIDMLPNESKSIIDLPYDFDIMGTWLEDVGERTIGKPVVKDIANNEETELVNGVGQKVSLYIPVPYEEKNVSILRDGVDYPIPDKNEESKYIFKELGSYEIKITTTLGNISTINFEVEDPEIEEVIKKAESYKTVEDIAIARDLVNNLPESSKKDEYQSRLNSILPNLEFETKTATANLDIYIKSENILSLSLNTNSVTFEDFSGVDDEEKANALILTINSSLPYKINAYLTNEIIGSKTEEIMDKRIFNIRANGESDYQTFKDTENPIILLDNQLEGNNITHGIDLMLKGDIAHKKDIYKTTIKFEVEQK